MPVTNVTSAWVSGNLVFYDKSGNIICTYDGTNRKVSFPSGSTLESLGTLTVADTTLSPNDLALAEGSVLVGDSAGKAVALSAKTTTAILIGNGTTITSAAMSGDVKMDNVGATTIQAKAVENTMIAAAVGTVLVGTKTSGDVTALDNSAEGSIVIGQGASETCAAAALSGDVLMAKTGAVTIQAKAVESTMIAAAAGTVLVGTKTSGDVTALDISAEGAMALGQGATETPAAYAMSGDVTMTKGGVTAIGAAKVTSAMLENGAGVAALLTAGLGGSQTIVKTDTTTKTIVALNGSKDRACLVVATVTDAFATGDDTRTLVTVGETDTADKMWGNADFPNGLALGTVLVGAFTNTTAKAVTITSIAAKGTGTGGVAVTVLAIPTT